MRVITILLFLSLTTVQPDLRAQSACPCCNETARQFDFWIGTWEVTNRDGKVAGVNVIELVQDSCVLRESWTSAQSDYTGTSYNFYNRQSGKWQQTWVDNKGGSLLLEGNYTDGKMILSSKPAKNATGKIQVDRITWTNNPDGTIRQHWEASTDEGKTWQTIFDGLYKRKG